MLEFGAVRSHFNHLGQGQVLGGPWLQHLAGHVAGVHQQDPVTRAQAAFKARLQLQAVRAIATHMKLDGFAFGALVQLFDPHLNLTLQLFFQGVDPGAGVLAQSLGINRYDVLHLPMGLDRACGRVAFAQCEAQCPAPVGFVFVQSVPSFLKAHGRSRGVWLEHQFGSPAGRAFAGTGQGPHVSIFRGRLFQLGAPALGGLHFFSPRLAGNVQQGLAGKIL